MWVSNIRVGDSHEAAMAEVAPGFGEYWKFLSPFGRSVGFKGLDGKRAPKGWIPTIEDAIEQRMSFVGTAGRRRTAQPEPRGASGRPHHVLPDMYRRHL